MGHRSELPRAEVVGVGARSDTSSSAQAALFMSSASTSTPPMQTSTRCSLVGVPPAVKFRRQIEAG
jgi:hypothetical protein